MDLPLILSRYGSAALTSSPTAKTPSHGLAEERLKQIKWIGEVTGATTTTTTKSAHSTLEASLSVTVIDCFLVIIGKHLRILNMGVSGRVEGIVQIYSLELLSMERQNCIFCAMN